MSLLEGKARRNLWIFEFGLVATALGFIGAAIINTMASRPDAAKESFDLGSTAGVVAIALGGLLMVTREK